MIPILISVSVSLHTTIPSKLTAVPLTAARRTILAKQISQVEILVHVFQAIYGIPQQLSVLLAAVVRLMLELYQENNFVHVRPILPSINQSIVVFQVAIVPLILEF